MYKELAKLGFYEKQFISYHDKDGYAIADLHIYSNDSNGKEIIITTDNKTVMTVKYDNQEIVLKSDVDGEVKRQALEWLKAKLES